jgi:hypothetical protein
MEGDFAFEEPSLVMTGLVLVNFDRSVDHFRETVLM